jgi:putative peptidoglycan lipid II flippase
VLGRGPATDAIAWAMRIPNLLQNLLGEGSLSASFIPVYAKLVEEGDERKASALAGSVLSLLALATGVIVLIIVLAARPLVWLFSDWENDPARYDLTVDLLRITTIGIGFLVISAWCLGVLNSHRSFFLSYVAPVVWNVTQIAALVVATLLAWTETDTVVALAWAVVVGGLLQVLVQVPKVRRYTPSLRLSLRRSPEVNTVLTRFAPAVGARGVVQVSSFIDTLFLTFLTGGAAGLHYLAMPLYITPISLFGFSVAAAELAEMSRRSGQIDALAARIRPALRKTIVPAGFVTAAYLAAGPTWADAMFGWLSRLFDTGLTDRASILVIGYLLMALAIGLPAAITARVTQNTLYSLGDVKGPARIAVVRLVVGVVSSFVLMLQLDWLTFEGSTVVEFGDFPHWPLWEQVPLERRTAENVPPHLGVVGVGLGSSIAAWTEWVLLRARLRRRLGPGQAQIVSSGWARQVTIAGVVSGVAMAATAQLPVPSPVDAVIVVLVGLAAYGSILWIQGVRPPRRVASMP